MGSPKDMIEQNVSKEIEKEKRQEKSLESLEEKIEKVDEKFDTLVDAVSDMKKVIEQALLGTPDVDEKFKMLKEKSTPEKPTDSEFGLDENKLIVSTEDRKMAMGAAQLRQARKERIQAANKDFQKLVFHDAEPKETKYKQEVPAPQMGKVKKDEIPDIFKVLAFDLNDNEDQWALVNKDDEQVYYVINKSVDNAKDFNTKAFAHTVLADMRTMGVRAAMQKHQAVEVKELPALPFSKKDAPKDEKKDEKKEELKEKLVEKIKDVKKPEEKKDEKKEEKKEDKFPPKKEEKKDEPPKGDLPPMLGSDFKRRFLRAFRLALSTQQKNLISNPLKGAWFKTLTAMDVEDPKTVIEATFKTAAEDHFEVALEKTEEYLGMSDEAFIEAESTIQGLRTAIPSTEVAAPALSQKAASMRDRAVRGSVMVTTVGSGEEDSLESRISRALPKPKLAGISKLASQLRR